MYKFITLNEPLAGTVSGDGTEAIGINNAGQIVGDFHGNNTLHGFLYSGGTSGTYTVLNDPNAVNNSQATDINNNGTIVGNFIGNSGKEQGFRYAIGTATFTTIVDPLGPQGTMVFGINDNGVVSGTY